MLGRVAFGLVLGLASVAWAGEGQKPDIEPARFDPVIREVEGWTVHVEPALIDGKHAEEGAKALSMLANHLQRIKILVSEEPLAKLQTFEFWVEHDHPRIGGMTYHPSKQWLIGHHHDRRLAQKIHIARANQLFSRHQMLKHPAVILHELAHAYHHQVLGFDDPEIRSTYEQAKQSGCYEEVLLYTGKNVRHYAMTDHKEYFAEGTEAYFYRNDFYPFVRAELKEFDPALHELLKNIWGPAE
ncbi:MAG: metallopeptidase [Planctomycetota bacterium]